jgi:hypothetical protein
MGLSILGFTIGGVFALILVLIGVIGVFGKKGMGQTVRSFFSIIPGNPKLYSAIILVIGLAGGGLAFGWGYVQSFTGGTASIIGSEEPAVIQDVALSCIMTAPTSAGGAYSGNFSFRADTGDLTHYYVDVINGTGAGAGSINGTLTCKSARANIRDGVQSICHVESDSFKSLTSTTDSNTYYILATSTTTSKVPGYSWAQTAYLNNGAVATTSSDQEKTELVFVQDDVSQPLGYYLTLPGDTVFNYLTKSTSKDARIICDGKQVGRLTITKMSV